MSLRINVNIYPSGGYFFVETDGTTIRANNSWAGVVARVVAYRKRNGIASGNPSEEVHAQACKRNPNACHEAQDPVTMKAIKVATLKGRVLAWAASLRARRAHEPLPFVDEGLMRARANVCAGCPAHTALAGGCGSCKKAVKAVREEILGGRVIDDRMAGCVVLGEDCAINTWLGDITVDNPELPGCCWRRRSPPA